MARFEIDWTTCKADKETLITTFDVVPTFDYKQKADYSPFRAKIAMDQNGNVQELLVDNPGKVLWFGLPPALKREVLSTIYGVVQEEADEVLEEMTASKPQKPYKKNFAGRRGNQKYADRKDRREAKSAEGESAPETAPEVAPEAPAEAEA